MISKERFKKSVTKSSEGLMFLTLASFPATPSGGSKIKYCLLIPSSTILAIVLYEYSVRFLAISSLYIWLPD